MNALLLIQLIQMAKAAFDAYPEIMKEFEAIKSATTATPAELASLNAEIAAMDAARQLSWKQADDALDAAAKT